MQILDHLWLIPALPLAGAALNGLFWKHMPKAAVSAIAVGSVVASFALAVKLAAEFVRLGAGQIPWVQPYFTWIAAGTFSAEFALQVDQLTLVMLGVVTGVGSLIHIYATGYMAREEGYARFFSYLNLFMFFMLVLVMGANYLVLFVGWEGVGLCSYLLIGFYYLKKSAGDAGKKAFIVNRIGDFGFLLALLLMFWTFGTLDYLPVFARATAMPVETAGAGGVLTAICVLLFAGACGKSAQLPLYVWLPDAMEGPTPVSALIHAATMVTAGVYMVARSSVLFSHAPAALAVVAVVGALTAIFAATIGLVQNDIKRVLAYSTVSQLGYMFLACGVGAYAAGIFHLMTHAFFKALLFLGAGSVIHALDGEQDLRHMGGLRKAIPWTHGVMLVATLAIAGAPLFSGFFSKDAILEAAFVSPYAIRPLYFLALATALLTAFYMFRLYFLTFHGAPRFDVHHVHVHESPWSMRAPLVALAALSLGGGWVGIPPLLGGANRFEHFLAPAFSVAEELKKQSEAVHPGGHSLALEWGLMAAAILTAVAGAIVAMRIYYSRPEIAERLAAQFAGPHRLLLNKYWIDEMYDFLVVHPIHWLSTNVFWRVLDARGIDGAVNGVALAAVAIGGKLRLAQSGNTRSYAAWVVLGAALVTSFLLWLVP